MIVGKIYFGPTLDLNYKVVLLNLLNYSMTHGSC